MKYAVCVAVFVLVCAGTFGAGYFLGKAHRQIEYVEKQVEVIKYVSRKNEKIYLRPNDNFTAIYKRMREQR